MKEELFEKCTSKLEQIAESFGELLEGLGKGVDQEARLHEIEEAVQFIYNSVNEL